jgi:carboxylesterase
MSAYDGIYNPHLEGDAFIWEGDERGVLLIHGLTATTAEVRPLGDILHRQGYTISGPLLPGHYTHPADLNQVRWQDWYDAVEVAYEELCSRCRTVFVGGESTGAVLSLLLATLHPEIAGILAYAPALRLNLTRYDTLRLRLLAPFVAYRLKAVSGDSPRWQGYYVNPLKGVLQLIALQHYVIPRLGEIRQPMLVMQGRQDITVDPSVPEMLAASVSSAVKEVYWMEHTAHTVILDQELEAVAEVTLAFLQRVTSGALNAPLEKT